MRKKRRKLGKGKVVLLNQMPIRRSERSTCPFSVPNAPQIDYKDVRLLRNYVSEQGKIMPCRATLVSQKKQRILAREIKRARFLALMPFLREDKSPKPYSGGGDRDRGDRDRVGGSGPRERYGESSMDDSSPAPAEATEAAAAPTGAETLAPVTEEKTGEA